MWVSSKQNKAPLRWETWVTINFKNPNSISKALLPVFCIKIGLHLVFGVYVIKSDSSKHCRLVGDFAPSLKLQQTSLHIGGSNPSSLWQGLSSYRVRRSYMIECSFPRFWLVFRRRFYSVVMCKYHLPWTDDNSLRLSSNPARIHINRRQLYLYLNKSLFGYLTCVPDFDIHSSCKDKPSTRS